MPDGHECRSHMPQPVGRNQVNGLRIEVNHFPLGRCLNKPPMNHLGLEADAFRWLGSGGSELAFGVCDVNNCPLRRKATMPRGGKREGAGRKPAPDSRSVPKSIRVSREMADYLEQHGTGLIEDAIRRTRHFREWAKSR